jgi:hypothetical protein
MRGLSGNSVGIILMVISTASFAINDSLLKLAMARDSALRSPAVAGLGHPAGRPAGAGGHGAVSVFAAP